MENTETNADQNMELNTEEMVTGKVEQPSPQRKGIEAIVKEDPFVRYGLADFRVIEFRPSQRADDIQERIEKT